MLSIPVQADELPPASPTANRGNRLAERNPNTPNSRSGTPGLKGLGVKPFKCAPVSFDDIETPESWEDAPCSPMVVDSDVTQQVAETVVEAPAQAVDTSFASEAAALVTEVIGAAMKRLEAAEPPPEPTAEEAVRRSVPSLACMAQVDFALLEGVPEADAPFDEAIEAVLFDGVPDGEAEDAPAGEEPQPDEEAEEEAVAAGSPAQPAEQASSAAGSPAADVAPSPKTHLIHELFTTVRTLEAEREEERERMSQMVTALVNTREDAEQVPRIAPAA